MVALSNIIYNRLILVIFIKQSQQSPNSRARRNSKEATNDQTKMADNNERNTETEQQENDIFIEDMISPLGIFLYKCLIQICVILTVGFVFGLFTDGAPPKWSYVYILPTVYDLILKIRIGESLLWHSTELFTFGMPDAVLYLYFNNWLVLLIFCWIIFLICEIGIYYQP